MFILIISLINILNILIIVAPFLPIYLPIVNIVKPDIKGKQINNIFILEINIFPRYQKFK